MHESVVETARFLAQTGETMLMRSAAIVTIGETGTHEDRELFESCHSCRPIITSF